jgi:hypothetical protein
MRDSINYNLKYFIMKMSGTKPMKNTMRKPPIRQEMANSPTELKTSPDATSASSNRKVVRVASKKVRSNDSGVKSTSKETTTRQANSKKAMDNYIKVNKSKQALKAATKAKATTETSTKTKAPTTKPTTETSVKTTAPKSNPAGKPASKTETSVKAPTMQMKKAGMKKKC